MWFQRKSETNSAFRALTDRVQQLESQYEFLLAQHKSLRGRVYALWGKGADAAGEVPQTPREQLPLSDPRLTKAEVRERLLAEGRLRPAAKTTN